jgi:uncharacterized membrane protein YeaQ/YmgE (transglycosylase-associated protein family)
LSCGQQRYSQWFRPVARPAAFHGRDRKNSSHIFKTPRRIDANSSIITTEFLTAAQKRDEMGDHFWPAVYPGLIIGLLYGLSLRGVWNVVLGMIGGVIGAAIAATITFGTGLGDGLPSAVMMIVGSVIGAYIVVRLGRMFRPDAG